MNTKLIVGMILGVSTSWILSASAQVTKTPESKGMDYSERLSQVGNAKTNESLGTLSGRDQSEVRKRDLMDAYTHFPGHAGTEASTENRTPQEMHDRALKGEFGEAAKKGAEEWAKSGGTFNADAGMIGTEQMTPKESHEAALRGEFGEDSKKSAEEWTKAGGSFNEDGSMKEDGNMKGYSEGKTESTTQDESYKVMPVSVVDEKITKEEKDKTAEKSAEKSKDGKVKDVPWNPTPDFNNEDITSGGTTIKGEYGKTADKRVTTSPMNNTPSPMEMHQAAIKGEYGKDSQQSAMRVQSTYDAIMRGDYGADAQKAAQSWGNMKQQNSGGFRGAMESNKGMHGMGNTTNSSKSSQPLPEGSAVMGQSMGTMGNMMQEIQMNPAAAAAHEAAVRAENGSEADKAAVGWQQNNPNSPPGQ